MIMTYEDAKEYLHIAENAYNVGAYSESADIVRQLAYFAVAKEGSPLTVEQRDEIIEQVKKAVSRFTFCPDECIWEDTCGLMDLFQ